MKGNFQRLIGTACAAVAILAAAALPSVAQGVDRTKAATVKAAYLLNFLRYTQWPEETFESPASPIVVTQVGECEVGNVLPEVIGRAEPIDGHPLSLTRVVAPDAAPDREAFLRSIERSHMLFVCPCPIEGIQAIVEHLKGGRVLTVGDTPDFAEHGGMIGFVLQRDRIVFEANKDAIDQSGVSISAKVLKLANLVGDERR